MLLTFRVFTYIELRYNKVNFPDICPYSLEELLDPNWLPSDNQGDKK